MMFRPILITALAAVAAAPSSAMDAPRQHMISFEHILGHVEEIGGQGGQAQNAHSSMRFIQNEIHEQIAPMLNHEGAIDRTIAADIVGDIFHRNGFSELRTIVTAMILHDEQGRAQLRHDNGMQEEYQAVLARLPNLLASRGIVMMGFNDRDINNILAAQRQPTTNQQQAPRPSVPAQKAISAEDECTICLEKLLGADEVVCVAPCNDHFHKVCIDNWLGAQRSQSSNCPNCRQAIDQLKPTPRN